MKSVVIVLLSMICSSVFSAVQVEINAKTAVLKIEGESDKQVKCPMTVNFEIQNVNKELKKIVLKRTVSLEDGRTSLFKELENVLSVDALNEVRQYFFQPSVACTSFGRLRGKGLIDISELNLEAGSWEVIADEQIMKFEEFFMPPGSTIDRSKLIKFKSATLFEEAL